MTSARMGASGGSVVSSTAVIPGNARKVVEDLREILKSSSEEEIYAMLRECNMDPNETVQRLMSQDTFHEVKRKRDKRKENSNRDSGDERTRSTGTAPSFRGGRIVDYRTGLTTGQGRGNFVYQRSSRVSNIAIAVTPLSSQSHARPGLNSLGASVPVSAAVMSGSPVSKTVIPPSESLHDSGSVGPHASSIDGKASNASERTASDLHSINQATAHDSKISSSSEAQAGTDPSASRKSRASNLVGANKQDVSRVEDQKAIGDQASRSVEVETGKSSQSPPHRQSEPSSYALNVSRNDNGLKASHGNRPISVSCPQTLQQVIVSVDVGTVEPGTRPPPEVTRTGNARTGTPSSQYNSKTTYQPQQQPVGTHKEWKPKLSAQYSSSNQETGEQFSVSEVIRLSSQASPSNTHDVVPAAASKLEELSLQEDNQLVIIPHYLQVQEVDLSHLTFGTFRAGFGNKFNSSLDSEETVKSSSTVEAYTQVDDVPNEEQIEDSSAETNFTRYNQDSTSSDLQVSNSRSKMAADFPSNDISASAATTLEPETSKPEPVLQQSTHHTYVSAASSYSGLAIPTQTVGLRYSYNSAESQPQEVSRLRSFVQQPYPDSTNFYSPHFRGNSDGDVPYGQLISTNTSSKFIGGVSLLSGQSLSSPQEGVNSHAHSASSLTGQFSQSAGIGQMTLTMPQQHLAVHPYPGQPAGLQVSPFATNVFGYQFVPPSYTYMHTLYHNYAGNTGYAQLPAGSNYAPAAAGNTYSPTGGAIVKYPMPQYKTLIAAGGTPHAAIAAGYGSSTPVYAVNPAVSAGNTSGYEDATVSQYKAEGSGVWIQAQSSRDMASLQTNSYYNFTGQGQHAGYMHTQATNAHPALNYASLYQLPQSNPASSAHQLLQQPQALGAIGAAATSYQQGRSQVNWGSNY